ncbi:hypothetical protein LSUB1_G005997 [Lachnellula subtilissima]|uniref:T6SS Phospholipase effector Tle1-like catalytic domain-containing protein n=1 Tax=Lachnellula subtilissima TaxID=602034 RepID=A0A8H8RKD9_9HELO|nr:hypothetical protein LSUB1_G005997 [Lachnellula subtilissima]
MADTNSSCWVWDTVGSLGIPLPFHAENVKEFSFVNTKVAVHVQHAFQALGLDEHRKLFTPTLWEWPTNDQNLKKLRQCWFPGVHSNIGGSYPDAGISNITLAWMISQFEESDGGILTFDPTYLDWLQDLNNEYYIKQAEPIRPWALGKLYDSAPHNTVKGIVAGLSPVVRTPGRYHVVNDKTGLGTNIPLKNTCEFIHPSVRNRMNSRGIGTEEDSKHVSEVSHLLNAAKGLVGVNWNLNKYSSAALKNYELVESVGVQNGTTGAGGVVWKAKDGGEGLPEEELGRTEIRLLKRSVDMASKL